MKNLDNDYYRINTEKSKTKTLVFEEIDNNKSVIEYINSANSLTVKPHDKKVCLTKVENISKVELEPIHYEDAFHPIDYQKQQNIDNIIKILIPLLECISALILFTEIILLPIIIELINGLSNPTLMIIFVSGIFALIGLNKLIKKLSR